MNTSFDNVMRISFGHIRNMVAGRFASLLMAVSCVMALTSCGDSLEDSIRQYLDEGRNRYLGKCENLVASPGWERILLTWDNNVDPVIDSVRIVWSKNDEVKTVSVPRGTKTYSIDNLTDGNYKITICSVGNDGSTSLETTVYARPFTENHESVQSMTRIVSAFYYVKNHLVLFFQGWDENINEAHLQYTRKNGEQAELALTSQLVAKRFYLLPEEIDATKPVFLYRKGRVVGCIDPIVFSPVELDHDKLFSAEFKQILKRTYGFDQDIPDEWADNVEELSIDWTIANFQDLMNLPRLKKLVLGKHRYILPEMADDKVRSQSKVYEAEMSDFVLATLAEYNGLEVERYNNHYADLKKASYIKEMGATTVPDLTFIDLKGLRFTSDPEDVSGYDSHLEYLTDGNVLSAWEPYLSFEARTYTLTLDLKEVKHLNGIMIVQAYFDQYNEAKRDMIPGLVRLKTSKNQVRWELPTYIDDISIGESSGETNIIPFVAGGIDARYVQISVTTPLYIQNYCVSLAEIGLY